MGAKIGDRIVTISETRWWKPGETGEITSVMNHSSLWYADFTDFDGDVKTTWCLTEKDFVVVSRAGDPVQLNLF